MLRVKTIKGRMMLVYLLIIVLMMCSAAAVFRYMNRRYSDMLYQETSDSLFLISGSMKMYLDEIEQQSRYLATDSTFQENLSFFAGASSSYLKNVYWDKASDSVFSYAVSSSYIISITLNAGSMTVTRGRSSILQEDREYVQELIEKAEEKKGRSIWAVSRTDPSSLLLVRSCREVKNLSLKNLGTILVRIDLDSLIRSVMDPYQYLVSDVPVLILDEESGDFIYGAETLSENEKSVIESMPSNGYRVLSVNQKKLFAVRCRIENMDWSYCLLIPYQKIFSSLQRVLLIEMAVLFAVSILMLFLAEGFSRRLGRHLTVLQMKMKRVRENNLIPLKTDTDYGKRQDEIGYLHQSFDEMLAELRQLIRDNYEKQIRIKEVQIRNLEQQINPHFLNNTLDLIYWTAQANGQQEICVMTDSLAKLLHGSLSIHSDTVSLEQELKLCHYYLNIQKLRFVDKLIYREAVPENLLGYQVPFLCIQPLLENAIRYGVEPSVFPCETALEIRKEESILKIVVSDEGNPVEENIMEKLYSGEITPNGHGIGLLNIDKRAKLLYGDPYGVSFSNAEEKVFVILKIPAKNYEKDGASDD